MDIILLDEENPQNLETTSQLKSRFSLNSILNKFLFFLLGASITCIGSTGRLTSKAFGTENFISNCFSVYIYLNLSAFLVVLLFIHCNYRKAIISGWICVLTHILYIAGVGFTSGKLAKNLYISMYAAIAILEPFIIQSNSYVVSKYYSSSVFSNLYSGYYGGMAIFSLFQTIIQYLIGTETPGQARTCLILSHSTFALIVFFAVSTQTIIYLKSDIYEPITLRNQLLKSCIKKLKGMYSVLLSLPKYSCRFIIFNMSDLCKCAFFQVFIPYRMLINDTQLIVIFFMDNLSDIIGRSIASSADDTVVPKPNTKNHHRFLYFRDIPYLVIVATSWIASFLIVWATWTLKVKFLTEFVTIIVITVLVCFSLGYCSTRGINGCIPTLEYFDSQMNNKGEFLFQDKENKLYSYVNDLNTFFIKFFWMLVFLAAYFLAQTMEKYQSTEYYQDLKNYCIIK